MHPALARKVLSSSQHLQKGYIYHSLHPWLGFGVLTASGEKWKKMRRLVTPAFHFEVVYSFGFYFNETREQTNKNW